MSRFFIVMTPVVFAPYFASVRRQADSHVYMACFALFITFALVSLLNVVLGLEDPFRSSMDSVKVYIYISYSH